MSDGSSGNGQSTIQAATALEELSESARFDDDVDKDAREVPKVLFISAT